MKLAFLSLFTIFLLACQPLSPDSVIGEVADLPSGWASTDQAQAGIDTKWISRFGDSQLNRLVKEGLKGNPGLRVQAERLQQSAQNAKVAGAAAKPTLDISSDGNRQQRRFVGFAIPGLDSTVFNTFGVSLNASWELDIWGRVKAAQQAEIAAFEAQRWNLRAAEASLEGQIVKAYLALCEANTQVRLAEEAIVIRQQTRDAIAERFERALVDEGGTATQYRTAESDIATTKADLVNWKSQVESAKRQIELLIGRYPAGQLSVSRELPSLPSYPPVGLPSELLLRRPDILEAERRLAESGQREEEALKALYPRFSLTGSTGTTTSELSNILNSDFGIWSLGANLSHTILAGGRLRIKKASRNIESKARLIELQDTVIQACGEVEAAISAERFLRERVSETNKALDLAKEAGESARLDYRDGTSTLQTVLNAEARIIQSASSLTTLNRLLLTNRVDLHLALGGDFRPNSK